MTYYNLSDLIDIDKGSSTVDLLYAILAKSKIIQSEYLLYCSDRGATASLMRIKYTPKSESIGCVLGFVKSSREADLSRATINPLCNRASINGDNVRYCCRSPNI